MPRFFEATLCVMAFAGAAMAALGAAQLRAQSAEPVYQGRAIFQPVTPPIVPESFQGRWSEAAVDCRKAKRDKLLTIVGDRVVLFGRPRQVGRVLLRSGQEPPWRDAILELRAGGVEAEVMILSRKTEGQLDVRLRGSEKVRRFLRCAA